MNSPTPLPRDAAEELQIRRLMALRDEMAGLHAKLVYLKLMMSLGVRH